MHMQGIKRALYVWYLGRTDLMKNKTCTVMQVDTCNEPSSIVLSELDAFPTPSVYRMFL